MRDTSDNKKKLIRELNTCLSVSVAYLAVLFYN